MARKIRSDSVLDSMPLHQQDALIEWLMEDRLTPDKAIEKLWMDFGVKTSETALGYFWHRHCAPRLLRRSADAALAFPEEAGGLGIDWAAPSKALIQQKYFELLSAQQGDPKQLTSFAIMIADLARGDLEKAKLDFARQKHAETTRLKDQDFALQREKFESQERKNLEAREKLNQVIANKGGVTPETLLQIEEALRLL